MTERSSPSQATKPQKGLFRPTKLITRRKRRSWDETYLELVAFQQKHGHCNVPHRSDWQSLASWVTNQKRRTVDLRQDQIARLNQIGFNWSKRIATSEQKWNDQFQELLKYKRLHGDTKVPLLYEANPKLGRWVSSQRASYHWGTLCQDRREKLDEIDFIWSVYSEHEGGTGVWDRKWKDVFDMLVEFHREHGHCLVPRFYKDNKLSNWVLHQRRRLKQGRMREKYKKLLDEIGFFWSVDLYDAQSSLHQRHWDQMLDRLVRFKEIHLHTQVPAVHKEDPELGQWVHMQRTLRRINDRSITAERMERLESIGFWWGENEVGDEQGDRYEQGLDRRWNKMLEKLKAYKRDHGHMLLAPSESGLGRWVHEQRSLYHKKELQPDRIEKLNSIAFAWEARALRIEKQWMIMYEKLLEFKEKHGRCMVPSTFEDPKLARWITKQRREFENKIMADDRKELLDGVGFTWSIGIHQYDRKQEADDADDELTDTSEETVEVLPKHEKRKRLGKRKRVQCEDDDGLGKGSVGTEEQSRTSSPKDTSSCSKEATGRIEPSPVHRSTMDDESLNVYVGRRVALHWSQGDEYYKRAVGRKREADDADVELTDTSEETVEVLTRRGKRKRLGNRERVQCEDDDELGESCVGTKERSRRSSPKDTSSCFKEATGRIEPSPVTNH